MLKIIFILCLFCTSSIYINFLDQQKRYPRVRQAITQKLDVVEKIFTDKKMDFPPKGIFLRVFKSEKIIELWAHSAASDTFAFVKTYNFCTSSGILGPKRKQGDYQIPEGFYFIDRFNPTSNFHLSLGINYPNKSDRIAGKDNNLGGDIFIHGNCVTIGCIPITDDLIKELYLIAVYSKNNGQDKIPVHIFPVKMYTKNLDKLYSLFEHKNEMFWSNLKEGFDYFDKKHQLPKISVNQKNGHYIYN